MSEQEFADFQDDYQAMLKRIGVSPESVKNDLPKTLFGVRIVGIEDIEGTAFVEPPNESEE